jgi:hypothetical protein
MRGRGWSPFNPKVCDGILLPDPYGDLHEMATESLLNFSFCVVSSYLRQILLAFFIIGSQKEMIWTAQQLLKALTFSNLHIVLRYLFVREKIVLE